VGWICSSSEKSLGGREMSEHDAIELEMWRDGNILHEIHRDELEKVERERDQWRECAEGLILYAREALNKAAADKWGLELQRLNADIARYERLKEASK
jgi:hypothetical protein